MPSRRAWLREDSGNSPAELRKQAPETQSQTSDQDAQSRNSAIEMGSARAPACGVTRLAEHSGVSLGQNRGTRERCPSVTGWLCRDCDSTLLRSNTTGRLKQGPAKTKFRRDLA